jgi:outer membrane protein assembly factor BamC
MPTPFASGRLTTLTCACALVAMTAGCSSVSDLINVDNKVDYRTSGSKAVKLEVPPDLSQLNGQGRYGLSTAGTVTANSYNQQQGQASATAASPSVAARNLGGVTMERDGQVRWLVVDQSPEQVWQQVRDFWAENGFELTVDQAKAGVMETNWSENRAKLGQDGLRQLTGRLLDNLYDTGERDMFRTRIERTAKGSEIYVSHRGLQEIYTDTRKEQTTWKARPSDPELESMMISRMLVKLGASKETAQAVVASGGKAAPAAARASLMADGVSIALKGDLDQAWRRVGLALDRGGFTVEDRDRSKGMFEVRLASAQNDQKAGGWTDKVLGWFGSGKPSVDTLTRYRVQLAPQGADSSVSVQTGEGKPTSSDGAKQVAKLLAGNLE